MGYHLYRCAVCDNTTREPYRDNWLRNDKYVVCSLSCTRLIPDKNVKWGTFSDYVHGHVAKKLHDHFTSEKSQ